MNRFKKELRKHGVKLECDYEMLPYERDAGFLEGVVVDAEQCKVVSIYTSIVVTDCYDRQMQVTDKLFE